MTTRRILAAGCLATGALLLTACGAGHGHAASSSVKAATVVEQHNPVDILRKSGCTIPPDEKIGQPTLFNDGGLGYYADGYWGDPSSAERITVWRYPSHAIMLQGNGDGPTRRDGMTFIMSNDDGDWFAEVFAGDSGLASGPTPTTIAQLIGGHIA